MEIQQRIVDGRRGDENDVPASAEPRQCAGPLRVRVTERVRFVDNNEIRHLASPRFTVDRESRVRTKDHPFRRWRDTVYAACTKM